MATKINYNDYQAMSTDELRAIEQYAKKIIEKRDEDELYAVQMCDADLLMKSLKNNPSRKLTQQSWSYMIFKHVPWEQCDFIDLVMSLPEFNKKQKELNNSAYADSWTEELVTNKINDERFLNYFYHHPVLHDILKKAIEDEQYLHSEISEAGIDFLLDKKLIVIDPDLVAIALKSVEDEQNFMANYLPYIKYGIKNNLLEASAEQFVQLYEKHCYHFDSALLRHIQQTYLKPGEISFTKIMDGNICSSVITINVNYKSFIKFNNKEFNNLIRFHPLSEDNIKRIAQPMINILSSQSASEDSEKNLWQNLFSLIETIRDTQPEKVPFLKQVLKGKNSSKEFQNEVEKLFLYVKLDSELEENKVHSQINKPIKI
jgi:hypothetical protein